MTSFRSQERSATANYKTIDEILQEVCPLKFIHTADIHWNMVPDSGKPWSESRARAIRHTFQGLISLIEEEQIPLLLIAGDLFHHQPLLKDLNEINILFR